MGKQWVKSVAWSLLVLIPVALAWFTFRVPLNLRSILEIVGLALLFFFPCIITAIVIAKLTPKWIWRGDLVLLIGGFVLLWIGLRWLPTLPIASPIYFLDLILTGATMILPRTREVVRKGWPKKPRKTQDSVK